MKKKKDPCLFACMHQRTCAAIVTPLSKFGKLIAVQWLPSSDHSGVGFAACDRLAVSSGSVRRRPSLRYSLMKAAELEVCSPAACSLPYSATVL